jgi:hypothetical protein
MIRRRFVDRDRLREDFFQRLDRWSDAIANLSKARGIGRRGGLPDQYAVKISR